VLRGAAVYQVLKADDALLAHTAFLCSGGGRNVGVRTLEGAGDPVTLFAV